MAICEKIVKEPPGRITLRSKVKKDERNETVEQMDPFDNRILTSTPLRC
jgi:hypothetical protein